MKRRILIVGQGFAGTLLGWEFERAGIDFEIADAGLERGASKVAAGIINPITGQRVVKSWRVDEWLPVARDSYRALEKNWDVRVWRDMRVRRLFANERERQVFERKRADGELGAYIGKSDTDGFWITPAARVDPAALLEAARTRWLANGRLQEREVDLDEELAERELVIDCTGAVGLTKEAEGERFGFGRWQFSKGECLTLRVENLADDVILNRGHWILPVGRGLAKAGATNMPGRRDAGTTEEAREELEKSVTTMMPGVFEVVGQEAGVRVYAEDKRPVAGRHPSEPRLGMINGLGAKGALWAPMIAKQWVRHLLAGAAFDPEIDVRRGRDRARWAK